MNENLKNMHHECDLCVIGGGFAGMCTAIVAARHGLKVVIMQDRPVFGGNASGEIRMWVCGAHGSNNRETGIMEEICLENLYRNPYRTWPVWDSILYEFVKQEENITSLLNCSCFDCVMDGENIMEIVGWQMTTYTFHTVRAKFFADCSGDSILAPLTGAEYTAGREGREQYGESIAPQTPDKKTMGLSCLIQAREMKEKRTFIPPKWAHKFTKEDFAHRFDGKIDRPQENFWYLELGGTRDTIEDTEEIRDELIKIAYGMWDYIKNSGECNADNWELDFVGFLPGKRESRRYIGDYVMTENDVRGEGKFDDLVAFGGWTMDDHDPEGIGTRERPNIHHPAPSPFGIPYRSLYSKNIQNLFFAGRNISVTHCAMSATRVMATCATIGQAVGTAASLAVKYGLSPRGVYREQIGELKQLLMEDGCYLPGNTLHLPELMKNAQIMTNGEHAELLINGHERQIGEETNCWRGKAGDYIEIRFDQSQWVEQVRIVLDSDLDRKTIGGGNYLPQKATIANVPANLQPVHVPETLVKDMRIEVMDENGKYETVVEILENHQRIITPAIGRECRGIRMIPLSTHGSDGVNIFSVIVK